jgi:hypothetical protein
VLNLSQSMTRAGLFWPSTVPDVLRARVWSVRTLTADAAWGTVPDRQA